MIPRIPSLAEKEQLITYLLRTTYDKPTRDDYETTEGLIAQASIAVFDHYITDGPGYAGKVMMVIWSGSQGFYEVYTWERDELRLCEKE